VTFEEFKEYVFSDMYRQKGRCGWRLLLPYFFSKRSFRISFLHRLCNFSQNGPMRIFLPIFKGIYRAVCVLYNVDIPVVTKIGKGFLLYHAYGTVISDKAILGDNMMLGHQVTIGTEAGESPAIGNQVRIAPGAKIIGGVKIGDNVVVGANAVVINDVPSDSITVGVPNRIIKGRYIDHSERYFWKPSI
jgi:serine O-acetyltransferase